MNIACFLEKHESELDVWGSYQDKSKNNLVRILKSARSSFPGYMLKDADGEQTGLKISIKIDEMDIHVLSDSISWTCTPYLVDEDKDTKVPLYALNTPILSMDLQKDNVKFKNVFLIPFFKRLIEPTTFESHMYPPSFLLPNCSHLAETFINQVKMHKLIYISTRKRTYSNASLDYIKGLFEELTKETKHSSEVFSLFSAINQVTDQMYEEENSILYPYGSGYFYNLKKEQDHTLCRLIHKDTDIYRRYELSLKLGR